MSLATAGTHGATAPCESHGRLSRVEACPIHHSPPGILLPVPMRAPAVSRLLPCPSPYFKTLVRSFILPKLLFNLYIVTSFTQNQGGLPMRIRFLPLVSGLLLTLAVSVAYAAPGDVLADFASPAAHPTGMTFDGTHLWVADRLTDSLYAVDPADGSVQTKMIAPGYIPRGMTFDGTHLWVVDLEENRLHQVDPQTGISVHSIEAPTPSIQGIAWDGENLWIADDRADVICQISTADGTTIERFASPAGKPTGLTWWNGYLWCGDRVEDKIYLVAPNHDGEVIMALPAPGSHVRGLAVHGDNLWAADYQDDRLYKLVIDDGEEYRVTDTHTLDLTLYHEFRNYGPGDVPQAKLWFAIPHTMPNQKLLSGPAFSPTEDKTVYDRWNQAVAEYTLNAVKPGDKHLVTMQVEAELSAVRWFVFPHKVGDLGDIPDDIKQAYLVDEDKYRIDDPRIQKAIQVAIENEDDPYWIVRSIHRYIREKLHYELSGGWNVAPRVLERGNGSCSEYTFLFISMCRAAGIPARYVGAVVIRGDEASTDDVFHRWSQVYLPNYGWIHVDPQGGDKDSPAEVGESIGVLSNRFLITTTGGGASEYLGWGYNYDHNWMGSGPVKVHAEVFGEWSPVGEE
ncbi:transglutaminase [bacterium]|nr:transglutaminase [bacterium]